MIRTGIGYDSHRMVADRRLVIGGVEIAYAADLPGAELTPARPTLVAAS